LASIERNQYFQHNVFNSHLLTNIEGILMESPQPSFAITWHKRNGVDFKAKSFGVGAERCSNSITSKV
jgi:hypothetical protein